MEESIVKSQNGALYKHFIRSDVPTYSSPSTSVQWWATGVGVAKFQFAYGRQNAKTGAGDEADTIKSGRLFHASITRLLKKYLVQFCFDILYVLPRVTVQPRANSKVVLQRACIIFTVRLHVIQRTLLLSQFCPSVRPSVCLSDACIVTKLNNALRIF